MSRGLFATRLRRDVRREGVDGGGDQGDDHFDEPHGRVVDDGEDEDDDDEDGDDEKEIEKYGDDDSDDNDEGEETVRMNMTRMRTITTMMPTAVTMSWVWTSLGMAFLVLDSSFRGIAMALPPKPIRVVAVLIWILSRRADLGAAYLVTRRRQYHFDPYDLTRSCDVVLLLASYLFDESLCNSVQEALAHIGERHRIIADTFLMHTLLVEHVIAENRKGVVLDLEQIITKYIRLWAWRPMSDIVERRLSRLVWHRNERRRFGVCLRREWALTLSSFGTPRELRSHEIRRRVFRQKVGRYMVRGSSGMSLCMGCRRGCSQPKFVLRR